MIYRNAFTAGAGLADAVADLADRHARGHHLAADATAAAGVAVDAAAPVVVAVAGARLAVGDPRRVGVASLVVEGDFLGGVDDNVAVPAARREVDACAGPDDTEAVLAGGNRDAQDLDLTGAQAPGGAGRSRRGDTNHQAQGDTDHREQARDSPLGAVGDTSKSAHRDSFLQVLVAEDAGYW